MFLIWINENEVEQVKQDKTSFFVKRHLQYAAGSQAFECILPLQYYRYLKGKEVFYTSTETENKSYAHKRM